MPSMMGELVQIEIDSKTKEKKGRDWRGRTVPSGEERAECRHSCPCHSGRPKKGKMTTRRGHCLLD